jgi:hypothetical protein
MSVGFSTRDRMDVHEVPVARVRVTARAAVVQTVAVTLVYHVVWVAERHISVRITGFPDI